MMKDALTGKRILILGLARQGVAMARFAAMNGAHVVVSDIRTAEKLRGSIEAVSDLSIEFVLEQHPLGLLENIDLLAISGGVPVDLPIVVEAQRRGIMVTNDSLEFIKRAPCPVIGITGSAGKTTTTALTGAMINASGKRIWVGGNIGKPLLSELPNIRSTDIVVQELSSFQLEWWTQSPPVAAILNITPNHLDRHSDMEGYRSAKANILRYQSAENIAVLSADDPVAKEMWADVLGRLRAFSQQIEVNDGAFLAGDSLILRDGNRETTICTVDQIPLRGRHNISNVLAAITLADSVAVPHLAIESGIVNFSGVPHRLELVATIGGVQYINDSIATAPERVIAALDSFAEPVILLAGGRDKNMVWEEWAQQVQTQTKAVILFGELADLMEEKLLAVNKDLKGRGLRLIRALSLDDAVTKAAKIAEEGDIVLLAPGGTSFDSFVDFEARGEAFRYFVNRMNRRDRSNNRQSANIENHVSLSN